MQPTLKAQTGALGTAIIIPQAMLLQGYCIFLHLSLCPVCHLLPALGKWIFWSLQPPGASVPAPHLTPSRRPFAHSPTCPSHHTSPTPAPKEEDPQRPLLRLISPGLTWPDRKWDARNPSSSRFSCPGVGVICASLPPPSVSLFAFHLCTWPAG